MTTATLAQTPVNALADRFWEWFLETQPLWATFLGDERWNDRWDDPSPEGRAARAIEPSPALAGRRRGRRTRPRQRRIASPSTCSGWWPTFGSRISSTTSGSSTRSTSSRDPRTSPGNWHASSASIRPNGSSRLIVRLDAFPGIHRQDPRKHRGRETGRPHGRAPVIERTISQVRRALETPVTRIRCCLPTRMPTRPHAPPSPRPSSVMSGPPCRHCWRRSARMSRTHVRGTACAGFPTGTHCIATTSWPPRP